MTMEIINKCRGLRKKNVNTKIKIKEYAGGRIKIHRENFVQKTAFAHP
jgi:protein involved in sex pheromone biosynthesis